MTDHPPVRRVRPVLRYENEFVAVYDDEVEFGDGAPGTHLRILPAGRGRGVVVLAHHGGRVALVETYRYPIGEWQWGLVRGFSHGDSSEASARAELLEELGGRAASLTLLGSLTPDSGVLGTRVDSYLAELTVPTSTTQDPQEVRAIRWVPMAELLEMIRRGEIDDSFTLASVALAMSSGLFPVPTPPELSG